ncbi:MAG: ATP-dependent helicase RhlE [Chthoniobacter sp.]|jgi:ATP-dependent RNA helicase RhlE|nr:ATP-dependent helicase RhlE [Chthoniobacter sp.]
MPFRALGLGDRILKSIQDAGYTEPTPIQAAAIPLILAGLDLIGIAQTGTGKTAAFTLPMLHKLAEAAGDAGRRGSRALVVAPTRELVVQIEENVRAYARHVPLRMATVFGGVGERPQIEALRGGADLIIATPGRLLDLFRHSQFHGLQYLVLDEADRMLDMGFLPSIRQIVKGLPQKRQTLLFSATLSREIEALTHEFLRSPKVVEIGRRANPAETVTQFVYEVPKHLKPTLLAYLLRDPSFDSVLIFTRTKHGADRVARKLESSGIKTGTLHSNRSQSQRLRALKDFKAGIVRVLVATDIAARGIDVDGISHVVNFDFPMHSEDYVHRIGRTGRAQAVGDAISFVTPEDHGPLRSLERFIGRGIIRKKAEGFDYAAPAPPQSPEERDRERRGPPRGRPQQRPSGGSDQRRGGYGSQRSGGGRRPGSR